MVVFSGVLSGAGPMVESAICGRRKPSEHPMRLTDLNHGGARCEGVFVILAVSLAATVSGTAKWEIPINGS